MHVVQLNTHNIAHSSTAVKFKHCFYTVSGSASGISTCTWLWKIILKEFFILKTSWTTNFVKQITLTFDANTQCFILQLTSWARACQRISCLADLRGLVQCFSALFSSSMFENSWGWEGSEGLSTPPSRSSQKGENSRIRYLKWACGLQFA